MRAVLIEILLALVVAFCLAVLLFSGSLGFDRLASFGIGLLLLSSIFAAISALGPKYEPTPFLTPMMAGTMTAIVATTLVFAGAAQLPQNDGALVARSEQQAENMQASLAADEEPTMTIETMEDVPMDAPPPARVVEPESDGTDEMAMDVEAPVEPAPPGSPLSRSLLDPAPPPVEEGGLFDEPALDPFSDEEAPSPLSPPTAATDSPLTPAPAAPSEPSPIQLTQDSSGALAADPNAPLQLNPTVGGGTPSLAPSATPTVIPPLPRIRPR